MRLSQLTLAGFKSFAKTTAFEFPNAISAIVGPNGSGKSNVAEAIRWALGEQSMKTLRGRRGEDLIFSGSPKTARMGKAGVALTFDNRDRAIPLDFAAVTIGRKIFRDGLNEYSVNDSPVRLKDVVELLARIGLGETKHNIIGQGEVDRVLMASPRERRELLEEAIGLRIWQLKKREAERKLEETAENVEQVRSLLRELAPHLRFLKLQADKAEKRETSRRELEDCYRAYVRREGDAIAAESARLEGAATPLRARLADIERSTVALADRIAGTERGQKGGEALREQEKRLEEIEARRRELERELGRIEGRLEAEGEAPQTGMRRVSIAAVTSAFAPIAEELRRAAALDDLDALKARTLAAAEAVSSALAGFGAAGGDEPQRKEAQELDRERRRIQEELRHLGAQLNGIRKELDRGISRSSSLQTELHARWQELRDLEEERNAIREKLQRLSFDEERLASRRRELERAITESGRSERELRAGETPFAALEPDELLRRIEKLKVRLEEIGGIDQTVLKEFEDARARSEFLERELADLAGAERDMRSLIAELEERIKRDFSEGFKNIRESFHHYFGIIFGGGRGDIEIVTIPQSGSGMDGDDDEDADGNEAETGVDITVDLPRKRIKGLAMLSGGERALVSIALLFAITAVNPPPFLVLDETDAALDEANSRKYAEILKELSQKTQLILITHNRETMKQAAVLYGVTMGEDGISKILSLKLEEAASYGNR